MEIGVIICWHESQGVGIVVDNRGHQYPLDYERGQSFGITVGDLTPTLSGRHEQSFGHQLKEPQQGDPILFELTSIGTVNRWGYLRHYLELVETRHGTAFAPALCA